MATIITCSNQKGGVAKTSTCLALLSGLTQRGYKTLGIDLDPQSNLSFTTGVDTLNPKFTAYEIFKGQCSPEEGIVNTPWGFDLIQGGLNLAGADMEFTSLGREKLLQKALKPIKENYDYIIIDTPPTLGILTANALLAADLLVIPMAADIYSLQGISNLAGFIKNVRENGNPNLKIAGLLITKYNGRQKLTQALEDSISEVATELDTIVFKSKIRETVSVREAALSQSDIFTYAPTGTATIDYNAFIDELLKLEV